MLEKSLDTKKKDDLLKENLPPGNVKLLRALESNYEIKAAVTKSCHRRNGALKKMQEQLGCALSAVGRALSLHSVATFRHANNPVYPAPIDVSHQNFKENSFNPIRKDKTFKLKTFTPPLSTTRAQRRRAWSSSSVNEPTTTASISNQAKQ
ncbi:hypothetical protein EVAR_47371_1 [Eumeta japonica]|uniref:Uncharacterized protein n=1 Tax=Eumeta variegata TaxID=151549 RepID=A0A4C1WWE5_EUMVA|nr:hypothetical protein EVAR_47371_1 [Eumeta japonica]